MYIKHNKFFLRILYKIIDKSKFSKFFYITNILYTYLLVLAIKTYFISIKVVKIEILILDHFYFARPDHDRN